MIYSTTISLPKWIEKFLHNRKLNALTAVERMLLAIDLSARNVEEGTGGPFGAAIFRLDTNELVSVGVNRVVPEHCAPAHAEIMAVILAQKTLETNDLFAGGAIFELASSAQPCSMCLGATIWSGVRRLSYAATRDDVQSIVGFDEGPIPHDWKDQMIRRGIEIDEGMLRKEAVSVLEKYRDLGGTVYNSSLSI